MPKGKTYTDEDKQFLKELVLSRKDVVESRRTDAVSLRRKKSAWEEIAMEFNARNPQLTVSKAPGLFIGTCVPSISPITPGNEAME